MATLGDLVDNVQAQMNRSVTVERSTVKLFIEQSVQSMRNKRFDFKNQVAYLVTTDDEQNYPNEDSLTLETGPDVYRGVLVTAQDLLTKIEWAELVKIDWIRHAGKVTFTDDDSDTLYEFTISSDSTGYILEEIQPHEADMVRTPTSSSSANAYRWAWMYNGLRLWPTPSNNQLLELSIHRHTPVTRTDLDSVDNMWTDPVKGEPLIRTLTIANLYAYWTRKPDLAQFYFQLASEIQNRLETEASQRQSGVRSAWPERRMEWI